MSDDRGAVPAPRPADDDVEAARAEAARRRKERKAARAHAPAPERDPVYADLDLGDLRRMRAALADEETRVSYWRRIIQARLDVLRADEREGDRVADLGRVLADAPTFHRRLAHVSVLPVDDVPPLPDLAELWARQVDEGDAAGRAALEAELGRAEHQLSEARQGLFRRIDGVTAELIARYRDDPSLALSALPSQELSLRL